MTRNDIAYGVPKDGCRCPVANAMSRVLNRTIEVDGERAEVDGCGRILLPDAVQQFVTEFDLGFDVEPFSFTIDVDLGDDA